MDFINLKSLNLSAEESKGLIKFLVEKRGITTKKLLSTIKLNLKRKNNKDLASKSQQKLIKSQQKLAKTQLELLKTQQKLIKSIKTQQKLTKQTKSQRELIKSQQKLKEQQTLSNTRKIRNSFYNIVKKNNNNFRENKLDKKINNTNVDDFIESMRDLFNNILDKKINNNTNDDFIENIRDLFSILDYEPVLIKSGVEGNYLEYMSNGNNSLSFNEYLELIKPYLYDLINVIRLKENGNYNYQLKFFLFRKNQILMKCV